jgi:hypothetical protein
MRLQLTTLDHLVQLLDPKLYLHLQSVDSTNFFFFFRMLLVWYKREFSWPDVLRLWEGLWTDYLSANFHLFIAVAILEKHREVIMEHLRGFDEVLKYVNELSNTIDLPSTMVRAEALFNRFQRTVEAIDRKDHFPTPTLRQRKQIEGGSLDGGSQAVGHDGKAVAASGSGVQQQQGTTTQQQKEHYSAENSAWWIRVRSEHKPQTCPLFVVLAGGRKWGFGKRGECQAWHLASLILYSARGGSFCRFVLISSMALKVSSLLRFFFQRHTIGVRLRLYDFFFLFVSRNE